MKERPNFQVDVSVALSATWFLGAPRRQTDRALVANDRFGGAALQRLMPHRLSGNGVISTGERNTLIFMKRWSVSNEVSSQDLLFS